MPTTTIGYESTHTGQEIDAAVDAVLGDGTTVPSLPSQVEDNAADIESLGTRMTTAEGDIDAVEAVLNAADDAPTENSVHLVLSGGVKSALQTLEDTLRSNGYRIAGFIGPDNSYLAKAVEGTCYFITNPVAASWYGSNVVGRVYLQPGTTAYSNPPSSVTGWTQYNITGACIVGYKGGAWSLHNLPFTLLTQADELQTAINRLALNLFEELTGYRVDDGAITESDDIVKLGTDSRYGHGVLAVNPGQMFAVENYHESLNTVRYAFATAETGTAGAAIPCVGWGIVIHGTRQVITIPQGCTHLWWNSRNYSSRLYGVRHFDSTPTAGSVNHVTSGGVKDALGAVSANCHVVRLTGTGDNMVSSDSIYSVKPGNRYRLWVKYPEQSKSEVASDPSHNWLYVRDYDNAGNGISYLVQVPATETVMNDYYDFTVSQNASYIRMGTRTNTGLEQVLVLEDITTLMDSANSVKKTCYTSGAAYTDNSIDFPSGAALWWKNTEQGIPLDIEPNTSFTFSASANAALVLRGSGNSPSGYTLLQCAASAVLPSDIVLLYWSSSAEKFVSGALFAEYLGYVVSHVTDGIDESIDEVKASVRDVKTGNAEWVLCPAARNYLIHFFGLTIRQASTNTKYSSTFIPIRKGELVKMVKTPIDTASDNQSSHPTYYGLSEFIPYYDGESTIKLDKCQAISEDTIIEAPYDGYLSACTKETTGSEVRFYKLEDVTVPSSYNPRSLKIVSYSASRVLQTLESELNYGELINLGDNANFRVSDYIDVRGFDYIELPVSYQKATALRRAESGIFEAGALWYDGQKEILSKACTNMSYISGSGGANMTKRLKVPSGARYLRFSYYYTRDTIILYAKKGSLFDMYNEDEYLHKMTLLNMPKHGDSTSPLVFAHISDVHGGSDQYKRFVQFAEHWKGRGYIDDLIDTGDIVLDNYNNDYAWRDAIDGTGNILTVIGNHDTRAGSSECQSAHITPGSLDDWQYHSRLSANGAYINHAYNRYINPYVSNWGVTQPSNAESLGLCYYYKDYAGLRLICLDAMGFDSDQLAWLEDTLDGARTNNLHVCILTHLTGGVMDRVDCNYTSLVPSPDNISTQTQYNADIVGIPAAVDAFQDAEGVFVGYITGHIHRDMVNVLRDYPTQLVFAVDSGGEVNTWDNMKVAGCKSYDSFQLVSINTFDKKVRLVKVGADLDYNMRRKGTLCVSYAIVDGHVKGVIGEGW